MVEITAGMGTGALRIIHVVDKLSNRTRSGLPLKWLVNAGNIRICSATLYTHPSTPPTDGNKFSSELLDSRSRVCDLPHIVL